MRFNTILLGVSSDIYRCEFRPNTAGKDGSVWHCIECKKCSICEIQGTVVVLGDRIGVGLARGAVDRIGVGLARDAVGTQACCWLEAASAWSNATSPVFRSFCKYR